MVESSPNRLKTVWEKEKLLVTSNFPFPKVFSKDLYCTHVKTRAHLGKGEPFPKQALVFTCLHYKSFQITVFSTHLENFLPFSSNLKLLSVNLFSLKAPEIYHLGKCSSSLDKDLFSTGFNPTRVVCVSAMPSSFLLQTFTFVRVNRYITLLSPQYTFCPASIDTDRFFFMIWFFFLHNFQRGAVETPEQHS